jgi:hypothetical protein
VATMVSDGTATKPAREWQRVPPGWMVLEPKAQVGHLPTDEQHGVIRLRRRSVWTTTFVNVTSCTVLEQSMREDVSRRLR